MHRDRLELLSSAFEFYNFSPSYIVLCNSHERKDEKAKGRNLQMYSIFSSSSWFEVYDFVEIHLSFLEKDDCTQRIQQYNEIFVEEKSGYNFCSKSIPNIRSFLSVDNYLKRAILTVQITNVEQFGMKKFITTADPLILQTLSIISKKSLVLLEEVSNHLQLIDSSCHNRFAWKVQKEKIDEGYTSIFTAGNFEDFLKQGE